MKNFVLGLSLLVTTSVMAQSQNLTLNQTLVLKCPAGSSIAVQNINGRSVSVNCESSCRISAMEYCEYQRATGWESCATSGREAYVIVVYLPNGTMKKLSSNTVSESDAIANFPTFADHVVERGLCDKATY